MYISAEANIRQKEEIDATKQECQSLRDEVETLTAMFEKLREQQQQIMQKFAPKRIVQEMDLALKGIEVQLEHCKEQFEEESISVVKFIKTYSALRTQHHLILCKKEKFIELYGSQ